MSKSNMRTEEGEIAVETLERALENLEQGNPNRALTNVSAASNLLEHEVREWTRRERRKQERRER